MRSAGLLPFRVVDRLEVLVAHPGGPFWARKDEGAWALVKGLIDEDEDGRSEEGGLRGEGMGRSFRAVAWGRLRSGKRVTAWAVQADYDPETLRPGECTIQLRGREVTFPEIDRVRWFDTEEARAKLNPVYGEFLDRLERHLSVTG